MKRRYSSMAVAILVVVALTGRANWNQTGAGPHDYATPANWAGGDINGVWPSTLTLSAEQTVTFGANTALPFGLRLLHNPTTSRHALRFRGDGGARILTLQDDLWVDLVDNTGTTQVTFGSPTAGQELDVHLDGERTVYSRVLTPFDTTSRGLGFINNVTGTGRLCKMGEGALTLQRAADFSGEILVLEGTLSLRRHAQLAHVDSLTLGGGQVGAILELNSRHTALLGESTALLNDRLSPDVRIDVDGRARLLLRGHSANVTTQSVARVELQQGLARMDVFLGGAASGETALYIDDLNRSAGTVLMLAGGQGNAMTVTDSSNHFNLGQGNGNGRSRLIAHRINGATPSTARINGILPWAVFGESDGRPRAFATYGAEGFKPYGFDALGVMDDNGGAEAYVTTLAAAGATDNVQLSVTETISGTVTVNSLIQNSADVEGAASDTLVLTSGAVMAAGGNPNIRIRVDFAGGEGFVYGNNRISFWAGLHHDGGKGVTFQSTSPTGTSVNFLWNVASTYTGPTRILHGSLVMRVLNAIPPASPLVVGAEAVLDIHNGSANVTVLGQAARRTVLGSIAGPGRITAGGNTGNYTYLQVGGNNASTTFSGTIDNSTGGDMALDKVGSGTLTLTGANTYVGNTLVAEGGLYVDGSIAGTNVIVSSAAVLGGAGTIAGRVSLATGASLSPGATNAVGTLTILDDFTVDADAVYAAHYDVDGSDRVVVDGTLSLPSTLTVNVTALDGAEPPREIVLFEAVTLDAPANFSGWTVNGTDLMPVVDGAQVVLRAPGGTVILVR